jgi:diguanylate cyclase (GGDEF)-like protein
MLRADSKHGLAVLLGSSALCTALWSLSINGGIAPGTLFWDNVHWTVSGVISSWIALRAVRHTDATSPLRRTRIWLAAAVVANLGGSIVYDIESAVGYFEIPGYNVAIFVWMGPCLLLAFIEQLRQKLPGGRGGVVLIDLGGFSLALLVLVLSIYLPFFPPFEHLSTVSPLVFASYPVLQFAAAVAALVLNLHTRQRWTLQWQALFLSVCAQGVIWAIWNLTAINKSFVPWSLVDLGFSISVLTLAWGTAYWEPQVNAAESYDRLCEGLLRLLPLLNVALATTAIAMLSAQRSIGEPAHTILLGCAVAALLLAAVRQTLQLRERDKLIHAERAVAESQAQLEYLAHHDPLTGLPNLTLVRKRLEHAIESATKKRLRAALLFLDLDQFKEVNDTFGHATGDALLCHVARQLQGSLHWADTVSRQGGDEFTVVLADVSRVADVVRVAEKILAISGTAARVEDLELPLSVSLGIALYPDDGIDFQSLLQCADAAMYRAKAAGRNSYRFYDAQIHAEITHRIRMRHALSHAIERNELRLVYQPQIELTTGIVCGAEALLRWHSAELGSVPPASFIPVAEESGLIVDIGGWVLREACRQAAQWRDSGLPPLPVAVNISVAQFRRDNLLERVTETLRSSHLSPELLEVELTESVLMQDQDRVIATLNRLRSLGVSVSIDDFGTGYSSLAYLRRLAVGRLKIDASFVQAAVNDERGGARIVRAIIDMARALDLQTVAEGVETAAQVALVRSAGCNIAQGYAFSKPLAPEALPAFVVQSLQGLASAAGE